MILVANKADIHTSGPTIPRQSGVKAAQSLSAAFYEVSAKSTEEIQRLFVNIGNTTQVVARVNTLRQALQEDEVDMAGPSYLSNLLRRTTCGTVESCIIM